MGTMEKKGAVEKPVLHDTAHTQSAATPEGAAAGRGDWGREGQTSSDFFRASMARSVTSVTFPRAEIVTTSPWDR